MITAGRAVARNLVAHGVTDFFGVPGIQSDFLYNGIWDEDLPFSVYTARHEQGAAYMALGYAISSEKVGVCSVVPGVGVLNASAAIATANSLLARVLVLCGQIASDRIDKGTGQLHEIIDQAAMLDPIVKWQQMVESPDQVHSVLNEAFRQIDTDIPGVAMAVLPADVLPMDHDDYPAPPGEQPTSPAVDADEIAKAAEIISGAKRPIIALGGGAIEAREQIIELAERIGAVVTADRQGQGIVGWDHPLFAPGPVAHTLWRDADVVISIGTRFTRYRDAWGTDGLEQVWINVDPEAATLMGNSPSASIVARSVPALDALLPLITGQPADRGDLAEARAKFDVDVAKLEPQVSYLKAIRDVLPRDGIVIQDLTQVGYVSRIGFPIYEPRTFFTPGYMGTLGWGLPTAIGAKIANPDRQVVAILGDGGYMFTATELATAVQYNTNIVAIVFNNDAFYNVKAMQRDVHDGRVHATDLTNPDFVKMAESFGAQGLRANSPDELRTALATGFEYEGPTVIDAPLGDVPAPWGLLQLGKNR